MANLGRFKIDAKQIGEPTWTNLTQLANITKKCVIQNLYNACVVCEKSTQPTEDEGFIVPEDSKFYFKPIETLWIKPFNSEDYVYVNISE